MRPTLRTLASTLLPAALAALAACGGSGGGGGTTFSVASVEFHGPTLVVAAADYSGTEGRVFASTPAANPTVATAPDPVSTDVVLRTAGGQVYALNRFGADNLQSLDPAQGLATTYQVSTGSGSNPHDLALAGDRLYVTRYGAPSLLVADPTDGSEIATIDLSQFADRDGIPEMDRIIEWRGSLLVTLQRLDEDNFFTPTDHSTVAVIDPATNQVTASFDLDGVNPSSRFATDGDHLFVATTGSWGVADGGVERLNDDLTGATTVVKGVDLDGDLGELAVVSPTKGYVVVSGLDWANPDNRVVAFNPATGAIGATVYETTAYLPEITASPDGSLLAIADQSSAAPGVVLIDTATDQPVTTVPINDAHQLPPSSMVFLP